MLTVSQIFKEAARAALARTGGVPIFIRFIPLPGTYLCKNSNGF